MGNEPPKKNYNPKLEKQRFEIACIKVKAHLELQRDRRQGEVNQKEKSLIQMINAPQRSKIDEVHKASAIVADMNFINGCNIVIRYCDILKDRSMHICESKGNPNSILELMPFIESIIWATKPLNLNAMQEFAGMMVMFFGVQGVNLDQSPLVDTELKKCFQNMMAQPWEINQYMIKLSKKTGFTLDMINQAGHEFVDQPPVFPSQPPNGGGMGGMGGGNGGQMNQFQPQVFPGGQQQQQHQQFYPNQQQQQQQHFSPQQQPFNPQPQQQQQQYPQQFPPQQQNNQFNPYQQQPQQSQQQQQQHQSPQYNNPSQNQQQFFQQPPQQQPPFGQNVQGGFQQQPINSPQLSGVTHQSDQSFQSNPFSQQPPQQQHQQSQQQQQQQQPPNYNTGPYNLQPTQQNFQAPQQQQQQQPFNYQAPQVPQQNPQPPQNDTGIDSLEERLRKLREGL